MFTIAEILDRAVRLFPDKPYIIFEDEIMTYSELGSSASNVAHGLKDLGIEKGDSVAYLFPNKPVIPICDLGVQKIGGVVVPINSMARGPELRYILNNTNVKAFFTDANGYEILSSIRDEVPNLERVIVKSESKLEGTFSLDEMLGSGRDTFESVVCEPGDPAVVLYTSGTTGSPKGAVQTQKSVYYGVSHASSAFKFRFGEEKFLCPMPLYNNFGHTGSMLTALYNCGTIILIERWNTEKVLDEMAKWDATWFGGTPTMYIYLLDRFQDDKHKMTLKTAMVAGAKCPSDVLDKYGKKFPSVALVEAYGATELSGICTLNPVAGPRKGGSAGIAIGDAIIRILDDEGNPVKAGDVGEVVVVADSVCKGYWNDAENSKAAFHPEGWLSGDVGYLDEDGYLFLVERKKDLIIRGGANIFPAEVEEILCSHPDVSLAAVIGVPDRVKGELPKGYVVLRKGSAVTEHELIAYCRENLAAFKIPVALEFVNELPLSGVGKVLRRQLRDQELAKAQGNQ